jgi:hypothetical protein
MSKRTYVSSSNRMVHGHRSELVSDFLKRHGLDKIELPSTGSLVNDMAIKLAIWEDKRRAMDLAAMMIQSHDKRALSWYTQLIDLNLKLAHLEHEIISRGENPLRDSDYMSAQRLIADIRKQYDKMAFDLGKAHFDKVMKGDDDEQVLFKNVYPIDSGTER